MSTATRWALQQLRRREGLESIRVILDKQLELFNLAWQVDLDYAPVYSHLHTMMLEEDTMCLITDVDVGEKWARLTFCPENVGEVVKKNQAQREQVLRQVINHEIGHLIINPYHYCGLAGWAKFQETQAQHIAYACWLLRNDESVLPEPDDDLEALIDKAFLVCHLDENNWRVNVKHREVLRDGQRVPAFAYSNYHKDHRGLALLTARSITFEVDDELIGDCLPQAPLRELWRCVLNPYGEPVREFRSLIERKLDYIMSAMRGLGWR